MYTICVRDKMINVYNILFDILMNECSFISSELT